MRLAALLFLYVTLTQAGPTIPVWSTDPTQGNFGDRIAANALCYATSDPPCPQALAMVSYTGENVKDIYPDMDFASLQGIGGSWTALWINGIFSTLKDMGIAQSPYVWSGSTGDGRLAERNCDDWTSNETNWGGRAGRTERTGTVGWFSQGDNHCWNPAQILCICPPPTPNPTSYPSLSPTAPVIVYGAGTGNGNWGDRATSTSTCAGMAGDLALTCGATPAMLCYSGDPIADFPDVYGFSSNAHLQTITSQIIAPHWGQMLAGGGLTNNFDVVSGTSTGLAWSGCATDGTTTFNCDDWSNTGTGGTVLWEDQSPFNTGDTSCTVAFDLLCLCTPVPPTSSPSTSTPSAMPTSAPTAAPSAQPSGSPHLRPSVSPSQKPTHSPTSRPTTQSPTLTPTPAPVLSVLIYYGGSGTGNLGSRMTSTARCASTIPLGVSCTYTPALLCYTGDTIGSFPSSYNFPSSTPVISNTTMLSASWADMLGGMTLDTTFMSGVTGAGNVAWTGCTSLGALATSNNCNDFSGTSGTGASLIASSNTFFSGGTNPCSGPQAVLCVCVPEFSPTASPTPGPTEE